MRMGGIPPHSLTSAVEGSEWSASHPGHINPEESLRVGLRDRLDAVVYRKLFYQLWEIQPRPSSQLPVTIPTEPSRTVQYTDGHI
jgi:hypothetical protein